MSYGYTNNFANNLKMLRIASGMTMEELSKKSGVSMQTIGKYETNVTEPGITNLIAIAQSLNVPVGYLIGASLRLEVKEEIIIESSINPKK